MARARDDKTLKYCTPHERKVMRAAAKEISEAIAGMEPFKARITEARATVKGLGIKMKQFNVALALWDLERDEQAEAAEGLRKAFEALDLGKTLDFVDVLEAEAGNDDAGDGAATDDGEAVERGEPTGIKRGPAAEHAAAPEADHGELAAAPATDEGLDEGGYTYAAGKQAGEQGEPVEANPHQPAQPSHAIWARGWKAGNRKRAKAGIASNDAGPSLPPLAASDPGYSGMLQ